MLKTKYDRLPPKIIEYRVWKVFNLDSFRNDLSDKLNCEFNFSQFESLFKSVLDKHAPMRTKVLRGNNQQHLTKELRKEIMKRSKLKRIANQTGSPKDIADYRKQRNLVVKLNRQAKKDFFRSATSYNGSKTFWKQIKPLSNQKCNTFDERFLLVEGGKIVFNEVEISTIFNIVKRKKN